MLPYKANSSSVWNGHVASWLIDGDIDTYHSTKNYIPTDAWTRVYFMSKVKSKLSKNVRIFSTPRVHTTCLARIILLMRALF